MFEIALGVPGNFDGFSVRNPASKVWVGDVAKPWLKHAVVGTSFNTVDCAIHS